MKLSIVLSTHATSFDALAYSGDFARNVRRIAELGYDGVELAVRDPAMMDAHTVAHIAADAGLTVPAIGTGQAYVEEGLSFTSPDPRIRAGAIARIQAQADFAAHLGAQVIIGLIRGKLGAGVGEEQAMGWLVTALRECAGYAAQRDVQLSFEPLSRLDTNLINTTHEALCLLRQVGAPNLGLLLDTFHMNIEEPSIYASLVQARQHITHFHLSDSNRQYPGAGHVDFAGIVATLGALGYDAYLSAEVLPLPDPDICAARTIATMRPLLGYAQT
jgi:sugar phosphate isomerase/epimerase